MDSIHLQYLWMFLYNTTAAKCALGTALIVATLWAFLIKPLLQHYYPCRSVPQLEVVGHRIYTQRPPLTPTKSSTSKKTTPTKNTPRRKSPSPQRGRNSLKAEAKHVISILDSAKKGKAEYQQVGGSPVTRRYVTPAPNVTDEALASLFHSPEFVRWYELHRYALLQRVRVRSAQDLWMSIATLLVLLFGMFLLPFFSFRNEDATLWVLLQQRYSSKSGNTSRVGNHNNNNNHNHNNNHINHSRFKPEVQDNAFPVFFPELCVYVEGLLLLVAVLTLLTTAFMPPTAAHTATTALVAFLVLFCEAALVQRVAVGAGFAALLAVVAWRVRSVCGMCE
ncbi:uncharacterized protein TM35_000421180 [Trypanosoma theileri]|uniref:Uncharacterized protein n=1 Tax=Trypanosoma theileri TaxID=67003 RepID=A0A1X0NKM6_9TRYP|nr:uncharacterized protein TM35_000421180 [Trypanosoma theileri]ORC84660.1 hypothetical protein TM35_000421180 [Trypanosoma theileri]